MLLLCPCSDYTSAPPQVVAIHTFFSISTVSFVSSLLLCPSPSPGEDTFCMLWESAIYVAVLFYCFTHFSSLFYPLKDSCCPVRWFNPFDNLRAFTFHSYSFKRHPNLRPSLWATVRNLQISSLLPYDLSFSFLISRFLHKKVLFFSSLKAFLDLFSSSSSILHWDTGSALYSFSWASGTGFGSLSFCSHSLTSSAS